MAAYGLKKTTKHVRLSFFMKSEHLISGEFYVPAATSSAIRPSDALREAGDFISLVSAQVHGKHGQEHEAEFVQIARAHRLDGVLI